MSFKLLAKLPTEAQLKATRFSAQLRRLSSLTFLYQPNPGFISVSLRRIKFESKLKTRLKSLFSLIVCAIIEICYGTFPEIVFEIVLKIASETVHKVVFDFFLKPILKLPTKLSLRLSLKLFLNFSLKLLLIFPTEAASYTTCYTAQLRRLSSLTFLYQILVLSQCLCGE